MFQRNSIAGTVNDQFYFTKYSNQTDQTSRKRFRSFQTTLFGNSDKMQQIEQMFNNYNLFKYGKCVSTHRRGSLKETISQEPNKYKNSKQRIKDNENLKVRLQGMKKGRKELFQKLQQIRPTLKKNKEKS